MCEIFLLFIAAANIADDKLVYASGEITTVSYKPNQAADTGAGCIINHLETEEALFDIGGTLNASQTMVNIQLSLYDGEAGSELGKMDAINSPLKPASGWTAKLPEGTKEFTMITSGGYARRPAVILPDASGHYTTFAVYKDKKAVDPICVLQPNKLAVNVFDQVLVREKWVDANRHMCLLELPEDGSRVILWIEPALDCGEDKMFHPKSLYKQVVDHVGLIPPATCNGSSGKSEVFVENFLLESGRCYNQWQADAMKYLIQENQYEVVFSHLHNVDCLGHSFWALAKEGNHPGSDTLKYQGYIAEIYRDTDLFNFILIK